MVSQNPPWAKEEHRGWGKGRTIFYKTGNFDINNSFSPMYQADPLPSGFGENAGAFICNYVRVNNAPYGGLSLSALSTSIFYGTGHFQRSLFVLARWLSLCFSIVCVCLFYDVSEFDLCDVQN